MNYFGMQLKSQMQYKASFLLATFGQFLTAFASFFSIAFLFGRIDRMDDFSFQEVLLCFSVVMLSFSIGELFGGGLASFSRILGDGSFDRIMVRPRSILMQVLAPNTDFTRLGLTVQAVIVLAYAARTSGIRWTVDKVFVLALMIICGSIVFFALFLMTASFSFFLIESMDFLTVFTYGSRKFGQYPFSVYGKEILKVLTFMVPLALFQYYPLLYLIDRKAGLFYVLCPLLSLLFMIPSYALYRVGIRKFKSTGS